MKIAVTEEMLDGFLSEFNTVRRKFFYDVQDIPEDLESNIRRLFIKADPANKMKTDEEIDIFLTVDKVYGLDRADCSKYCGWIEQVMEKFLAGYVNIEGIQKLFHSSYFQFEWMMHLEYDSKRHDYTYYRDHYVHQIRNMFEMFVFLEDMGLWKKCWEIYSHSDNAIAYAIMQSIQEQKNVMSTEERKYIKWAAKKNAGVADNGKLEEVKAAFDQMIFHYIIFSTGIIASLMHDIGYPIAFVRKTTNNLQRFLPNAALFVNTSNQIPHISNLLQNSLLYKVTDIEEIEKRLKDSDHGALSAILLLAQYYDNGLIFHLQPVKRIVIELAAVVIYNHTLRYGFQNGKETHREYNVFQENPISYLFRLCDDLQEWKRVYFEVIDKKELMVCKKCGRTVERGKHYENMCDKCSRIETKKIHEFASRRMINVDPIEWLVIEDRGKKKRAEWIITMFCDLGNLLQTVRYRAEYAVKRAEGIHEIKLMLKGQEGFPGIYIKTYITNNPVAIKARILQDYWKILDVASHDEMNRDNVFENRIEFLKMDEEGSVWKTGGNEWKRELEEALDRIDDQIKLSEVVDKIWEAQDTGWETVCFRKSIQFYVKLLYLGKNIHHIRKNIFKDDPRGKESKTAKRLYEDFEKVARVFAAKYGIYNNALILLMADYLIQEFCYVSEEEFFAGEYTVLYEYRFLARRDITDIVKAYLEYGVCDKSCTFMAKAGKEEFFDFYSDYYLYYRMNEKVKIKMQEKLKEIETKNIDAIKKKN